jgi:hypothetical protein
MTVGQSKCPDSLHAVENSAAERWKVLCFDFGDLFSSFLKLIDGHLFAQAVRFDV